MTKVTLNPSEAVVAESKAEATVKDSAGRMLTLVKPNVLATIRLIKALGDTARNSVYMTLVTPITYLTAIDGDPVFPCATEREIEALIQRLDEHGLMALIDGVQTHFAGMPREAEEAALKNS